MDRMAVVGVGLGISLSPGQSGAHGVSAGWALGNSFSLQAGLVQKSWLPLCPGWPLSPPPAIAEGIFLWYSLWELGRASRGESYSFVWVSLWWSFQPSEVKPMDTGAWWTAVHGAAERCCFCAGSAFHAAPLLQGRSPLLYPESPQLILQACVHHHPVPEAVFTTGNNLCLFCVPVAFS